MNGVLVYLAGINLLAAAVCISDRLTRVEPVTPDK